MRGRGEGGEPPCRWKANWTQTAERFRRWWRREGLVLGMFGIGFDRGAAVHAQIPDPGPPADVVSRHLDATWVARHREWELSRRAYPAETLPIAFADLGTVTLATFLGATPSYAEANVWYTPGDISPDNDKPLALDLEGKWWKSLWAVVGETAGRARGRYVCGMPAIAPNLDVLAELVGFQALLVALLDNPEWVHRKLAEIQQAYVQAFERLYELIRLEDGSSVFQWFMIWGPGRVSQAQCDVSAMISPQMFRSFVVPHLRVQCQGIDHCLYHVDGPQALAHVDALLEIEELDAIEYTPGPQVPQGGDAHWYPLYRKILAAGKCLQVAEVRAAEVIPLLDAVGGKGLYILGKYANERELEDLSKRVEPYR